jgi:catalase
MLTYQNGFGVNTYRFVTDDGDSKLIKWHFRSKQGLASLLWEEAQVLAGRNPDYHRQDLWDAIEAGNGPEWDVAVQIIDEEDAEAFGFDLLDATKLLPEELVPLQVLGRLKLDANPKNYFAETEQIMVSLSPPSPALINPIQFQPGHIVRGIDFSEDPLLQGRTFSYLDTQLNRNLGSPNFEQIPINRPISEVHNNNRDGAGQQFIHLNTKPYTPNSLNNGSPKQANQTRGRGFFTAPERTVSGFLTRERPVSFADHWTQPRLFFNSLMTAEKQILVDAIRFETAKLKSEQVKGNVLKELNKVSNELANRVASFLGAELLMPDETYYHGNQTKGCSTMNRWLKSIAGLKVGILTSTDSDDSFSQAKHIAEILEAEGVVAIIVGERLVSGVGMIYAQANAADFDGILVTDGAGEVFSSQQTPLYPALRPSLIVHDAYRWGKPIGLIGSARKHAPVQQSPSLHRRENKDEDPTVAYEEEVDEESEESEELEEEGVDVVHWRQEWEDFDTEQVEDVQWEDRKSSEEEEACQCEEEESSDEDQSSEGEDKWEEEESSDEDQSSDEEETWPEEEKWQEHKAKGEGQEEEAKEEGDDEYAETDLLEEYGVYPAEEVDDGFLEDFKRGLSIFKFHRRFAVDSE